MLRPLLSRATGHVIELLTVPGQKRRFVEWPRSALDLRWNPLAMDEDVNIPIRDGECIHVFLQPIKTPLQQFTEEVFDDLPKPRCPCGEPGRYEPRPVFNREWLRKTAIEVLGRTKRLLDA